MIRRLPTPIDLQFEDIIEYEAIRREIIMEKLEKAGNSQPSSTELVTPEPKTKASKAQEVKGRIGIENVPKP